MKDPIWLERILECFCNKTEELVAEYPLPKIGLKLLQELWDQPKNEPMIGLSYEVKEQQAKVLKSYLDIPFDFDCYSYFLSSICTDLDAQNTAGGFMGYYAPPRYLAAFPDAVPVKPKAPTDSSKKARSKRKHEIPSTIKGRKRRWEEK